MSASAKDFAYIVKVNPNKKSSIPTISPETLNQYKKDINKYLVKQDGGSVNGFINRAIENRMERDGE